jgi:hypothetical protein
MKIALVLAALLGATTAQAADLTCNFKSSLGDVDAILADNGEGRDNISFRINGRDVSSGGCQAENSFRRDAIRCSVIVDRETRLEFYRAFFPRRNPPVKYSMIIWTNVSSNSPRVENISGNCHE